MRVDIEIIQGTTPTTARLLERFAAKGVVQDGRRLLLLRSRHGDYKFPGGGLEPGETAVDALLRELREECGLRRVRVGAPLVRVRERRPARESGAVFSMVSDYFLVTCPHPELAGDGQQLDSYERQLELTPMWVSPWTAVRANLGLLPRLASDVPWIERETRVLIEFLRQSSEGSGMLR